MDRITTEGIPVIVENYDHVNEFIKVEKSNNKPLIVQDYY